MPEQKPQAQKPQQPPGIAPEITKPIWLSPGETAESREYHAHNAVGQSTIKSWLKDPALFESERVRGDVTPQEPGKPLLWGLDLESLIFFDCFAGGKRIVRIPHTALNEHGHRRGKAWNDFKAQYAGQPVKLCTADEMEREIALMRAVENVRKHPEARGLIWGGERIQVAMAWPDPSGLAMKAQIDVKQKSPLIIDLKSCRDTAPAAFTQQIAEFGYHLQAYHYRDGWQQMTGERCRFGFVCVRNRAPWDVAVYFLDEEWFSIAERQWQRAKRQYFARLQNGNWTPSWNIGYRVLRPGQRQWKLQDWDNRLEACEAATRRIEQPADDSGAT